MSITQVTIPFFEANDQVRKGFEKEVSSILAGGADVQFVDENGAEKNIQMIGAFSNTIGTIKSRGFGRTDAQAVSKKLAPGYYQNIPTAYIYSSGTDASLGIHIRFEG